MSEIIKNKLYLGDMFDANDANDINRKNISCIICVAERLKIIKIDLCSLLICFHKTKYLVALDNRKLRN